MSRLGKQPVYFDKATQISLAGENELVIKGQKHTQKVKIRPQIAIAIEEDKVVLTRNDQTQETRALHGLYRALVQNAVIGVTKGFSKTLELVGVGYRASVKGKNLELTLGFSHPIVFPIPETIEIKVEKLTTILISGPDKQLVGQVAAQIRDFRPPEPYLGKGVKYSDEQIRRKAGKAAGK